MKDTHFRKNSGKVSRKDSSRRWLARAARDLYRAGAAGAAGAGSYRSRAAHKLIQMDEKHRFLSRSRRIVDLGAAPGGWSEVARRRAPRGARIVAVDREAIEPIEGVRILHCDLEAEESQGLILEALGDRADLILSDMAVSAMGHRSADRLRAEACSLMAWGVAGGLLGVGGIFLVKGFLGGDGVLMERMGECFDFVYREKPLASRRDSSEVYVLGVGRRAAAGIFLHG